MDNFLKVRGPATRARGHLGWKWACKWVPRHLRDVSPVGRGRNRGLNNGSEMRSVRLVCAIYRFRERPGGVHDGGSFRISLRSQPIDTTASIQPFIDLGLGRETLDQTNVGFRAVGVDLPVAFRDPLHLEDHTW